MFIYPNEKTRIIRLELRQNYFPQDWIEDVCSTLDCCADVSELSNEDLAKMRVACGYSPTLPQLLGMNTSKAAADSSWQSHEV